ncbi:DUF2500 domain-containing protein [Vibrio sp. Of7-15]|uniref:DUF2500 domain-containing protein n=1 Tax=Vibrio sp. Of7-15 TaxID=2724879 RepID=UPI001EF1F78B|nr:DUF2500 domain-containing protein [Vibrio sp. Of7-15]MCG7498901.1 DUF2500 domain-containing protein [Vibrio sp. Of7-15]
MPLTLLLSLIILICAGAWSFSHFYRKHINGDNAPEQKVDVTVLDKQIVDIPNAQPGQEDQEFWIYVQKGKFGPKREFQVGVHYFHALNPGDKGTLTYQGATFHHFAMKRD